MPQAISIHAPREGSDLRLFGTNFNSCISIHAPREGSDRGIHIIIGLVALFQSTLPARGATMDGHHTLAAARISIHAPREGSDGFRVKFGLMIGYFNPRSPRGERRAREKEVLRVFGFQSTLPARGATFPRERGGHLSKISIHAPREGSDIETATPDEIASIFQSTLPARGATRRGKILRLWRSYFNPRSPRGERRFLVSASHIRQRVFQSTLPARGATLTDTRLTASLTLFQSTLPARGATQGACRSR